MLAATLTMYLPSFMKAEENPMLPADKFNFACGVFVIIICLGFTGLVLFEVFGDFKKATRYEKVVKKLE